MSFNQLDKPQAGETIAIMKTNHGTMKLRLFEEIVGECATNFIELAKQGKYDGAPFHRIIKDFMIQGGDFTRKNGTGGHAAKGPGSTIGDKYDSRLTHVRGALSWAKTAMPHSIGSQFFIVQTDSTYLDGNYAAFGRVTSGLDVVDKIAASRVDYNDKPRIPQVMKKVTVETFGVEYPEPEKC